MLCTGQEPMEAGAEPSISSSGASWHALSHLPAEPSLRRKSGHLMRRGDDQRRLEDPPWDRIGRREMESIPFEPLNVLRECAQNSGFAGLL
jgi:hypothetical protein